MPSDGSQGREKIRGVPADTCPMTVNRQAKSVSGSRVQSRPAHLGKKWYRAGAANAARNPDITIAINILFNWKAPFVFFCANGLNNMFQDQMVQ